MTAAVDSRARTLKALADETFDVLVVGGGITGVGIARDAVLRGLKVALVEKLDFASGTSSKSTKLIHGGLRYLELGEIGLVFESVNERNRLMRLARHLVRPLPFLVAHFKGDRRWLVTLDVGLWLYEALCFFGGYRNHKTYRAQKTLELEPTLRREGLTGGILYYDAMTDDARLTLENALDARDLGAVIANHVRAGALLKQGDAITGVTVTDTLSGASFDVRAKVVVNATGPWSDEVRALANEAPLLKPTKGIHLVVDEQRLPARNALVMAHPKDKRVMFTIPWGLGRTAIGTTDTFFDGRPDTVEPTAADVTYLLDAANHYYPEAKLTPDDVISTWSGLRPLLKPPDAGAGASQVSREHVLVERKGFLTIAGGKLTTYRTMAAEVVDRAAKQLGVTKASATGERPIPGSVGLMESDEALEAFVKSLEGLAGSAQHAHAFVNMYGARAKAVLARCTNGGATRVDAELPWLMGQVDEAIDVELAQTLDDVLSRRLTLVLRARDQGLGVAPAIAARMAERLAWTAERTERELSAYRAVVESSRAWRRG
ncbi:MAG: glycerol-3-phosphate dehydrogenase/oxidase [Myxococcaceae bacterium]|nr:glycerol-3-phosphate dehydrogenase/oxidase [Myxococcaceae bacterium]